MISPDVWSYKFYVWSLLYCIIAYSMPGHYSASLAQILETPPPQRMKSELTATASYLDAFDMAEVYSMLRLICQFSWLTMEPLFL